MLICLSSRYICIYLSVCTVDMLVHWVGPRTIVTNRPYILRAIEIFYTRPTVVIDMENNTTNSRWQ